MKYDKQIYTDETKIAECIADNLDDFCEKLKKENPWAEAIIDEARKDVEEC